MKESMLLKIALTTSLVGLILLYIFSGRIEIDESSIAKIDRTDIGDFVKVKGIVSKVSDKDSYVVLQIEEPKAINVIFFKDKELGNLSINEQDEVEILGRVSEFKGKQQIVADRIRVIEER